MRGIPPDKRVTKAEIVQALRIVFPLERLLAVAGLARSVFFYHLKPKADKDAALKQQIQAIKGKHSAYGYRRMASMFEGVNKKRVQRLIQLMGLQVKGKKAQKYRSYQGDVGKRAPNLLQRNFTATHPHQKWVTDVCEFKANDGKRCYLSLILDLFNNETVAYTLSLSPNWQQVQEMLQQAVKKLPKTANPILHSDQGWQYQMCAYQPILRTNGITPSMSRKGNCLDNSAMESFFGRLKVECYYSRRFECISDLEQAIHQYIRYYNEERIRLELKGLSPIAYRKQSLIA